MDAIAQTLGINPQVIVANILAFLTLLWLMKKFAFGPIGGLLESRRKEIENTFQRIDEETARIHQTQIDLQNRLNEIEVEARSKIQEAVGQANRMKDEILAEARTQAEEVKSKGIQEIEREREKALQSIRENVADLVLQVGEKVIGQSINDANHRELISKTLDSLGSSRN